MTWLGILAGLWLGADLGVPPSHISPPDPAELRQARAAQVNREIARSIRESARRNRERYLERRGSSREVSRYRAHELAVEQRRAQREEAVLGPIETTSHRLGQIRREVRRGQERAAFERRVQRLERRTRLREFRARSNGGRAHGLRGGRPPGSVRSW